MFYFKRFFVVALAILFVILVFSGCSSPIEIPDPEVVEPSEPVAPGSQVSVKLDFDYDGTVTYLWHTDSEGNGRILRDANSSAAVWEAPMEPGTYNVFVTVGVDGESYDKPVSIVVEGPPLPTETSTPQPTDTPSPAPLLPTDTPTQIPSPTVPPTETPIPTATPTPEPTAPVSILNIKDGAEAAQSISLVGYKDPSITEVVWVFVCPLNSTTCWPQSTNACEGESTAVVGDRWEVRIGIGGLDNVGLFFKIVAYTANAEADASLSQTMVNWCKSGDFPGLSPEEMPAGLTLYDEIAVERNAEPVGDRVLFTESEIPGNVMIDDAVQVEGEEPQVYLVSGTINEDVDAPLWVFVYAPNGRYYLQSTNACDGIHTVRAGGQWQVKVNLGNVNDVGKRFEIVAALVSEETDALFAVQQANGCQTGEFPGFLSIEMPEGVDEKAVITVEREE